MQKINNFIGLAGIADNETHSARLWGKYFGFLLIGAVLWLVFQWHIELKTEFNADQAWFSNFIIWGTLRCPQTEQGVNKL